MKVFLRLALSFLLSGVFSWFAFRDVDFATAWGYLATVRAGWLAVFVACLVVIQVCRVFRFGVLIRPFADVSTAALLRISNVGLMLILALPLRLGEFARPYLLKQESGAPMSAGVGAVAVERTIDGLLVTLLFFVTTFMLPAPYVVSPALRAGAFGSLALFGSAMGVIIGALIFGPRMTALLHRLGDPISRGVTDKAVAMLEAFIDGLRALPDARAVAQLVAYTLVYWAANGIGLYSVMLALAWQLPPIAGFVVVCVLVLVIMIPAGPGMLGTFQAAIVLGLGVFGVDDSQAAAYHLIVYPVTVAVLFCFGLPYLLAGKIEVGRIVRAASETDASA